MAHQCIFGGRDGALCENFSDSFGCNAGGEPGCSLETEEKCRESINLAKSKDEKKPAEGFADLAWSCICPSGFQD